MRGTKTGIVGIVTVGLLMVSTTGVAAQSDAAAQESMTTQPIELPAEIPEGIDSGTLDTPLGPARWVHLSGRTMASADDALAGRTLPAAHTLIPWEDGVAAMGFFGLWTTSDGVDWAIVPLPGDLGGPFQRRVLKHVDGTYVLVYEDPLRVWTAEDLDGDWRELDVSALEAAAPAAGWKGRHVHMSGHARLTAGPVALEDGHIVFSVSQEYRLSTPELDLPLKETKRMRRLGDDRYALCGSGSCSDGGSKAKWTVRFKETKVGLSVVDDKTGKRLGRIDGADLSELYEGATGLKVASFEIDGDTVVPIDAPWPALDLIDPDYMPGGAMVFAPGGSTPVFRSWLSRRGLRPGDPGVPAVARVLPLAKAEHTSLTVSEHPDRLSAVLWADLGRTTYRVLRTWESTDGATWREGPQLLSDKARPGYTGSAWYAKGVYSRGLPNGKHWLHIGGEWVSIDELGFPSKIDPALMAGLGNVTVFTSDPLRDVVDVWVLTHPRSTDGVAVQEEWTDATAPVRSDLLPGVDLVTEEVGFGAYRVLGDGVRDLSKQVHAVVVTPEGDVWIETGTSRNWSLIRLGDPGVSKKLGRQQTWTLGLTSDGAPAARQSGDVRVFDGEAWRKAELTAYDRCVAPHSDPGADGAAVGADGGCWRGDIFSVEPRPSDTALVRLNADGTRTEPTRAEVGLEPDQHTHSPAVGPDGTIWVEVYGMRQDTELFDGLLAYDGSTWSSIPYDGDEYSVWNSEIAVDRDGVVWLSGLDSVGRAILSWDGESWVSHMTAGVTDGSEDGWFEVQPIRPWPNGVVWFGNVARWDGSDLEVFEQPADPRPRPSIYGPVATAPDGSAWTIMKEQLYVITPEAVTAAE